MKDKEKQNISMKEMLTKRSFEPITNCNCKIESTIEPTDKDKIIEEMAKVLSDRIINKTWRAEKVAKEFYKIAVPEDSVVLSREEWECLHNDYAKALYNARQNERKETAENFMFLRGYITKQFHRYHEARDKAESEYKKCKEEMGKAVLNNDWHRCDAIMFILEDIATEFDKLIKNLGVE